jgi:Vacuolar sorting protein 39 domain 2
MLGRRVSMSAERSCQACHNRIGNKMFAVYPNGVLVSRLLTATRPVHGLQLADDAK